MKTRPSGCIPLLVLCLVAGFLPSHPARAQTAWYDQDWAVRRTVTIGSTGIELVDYQVLVELTDGAGGNFDFDDTEAGGADVRFTGDDEITPLSFWIESWDDSAETARIWVRVPSVPASVDAVIYLYYGNPGAASASNGEATFEFFDDFETGSTTAEGYYTLTEPAVTVLEEDQAWEDTAPHSLSIVEVNDGGYQYWGYYGLQTSSGGVGLARSNDLLNWDKYSSNPLFSNGRWPSVVKVGATYYMAVTKDYAGTSHIVLRTSTDGVTFAEIETMVSPVGGQRNQNPHLYLNPNDGLFYLYWFRNAGTRYIMAKSAASVFDLDGATEVVVLSSASTLAAPNIMYRDGSYFLATEINPGEWQVRVYESTTSPVGGFTQLPGNPVLEDGSACMFQHVFGDTLHTYYCKLTGPTWTVDYRTADLTAGRLEVPLGMDPTKWSPTGGTWDVTTATQPDGSIGTVARGETTDKQMTRSSFSGDDYVVEAYGQQVAGRVWGISVRATDASNHYFTNLYEDLDTNNNLYAYSQVGGSSGSSFNTAVGTIDLGTWYQLGVRIGGDDLAAYLDGSLELQGSHSGLTSGQVALFGEGGTVAYYDDVRVRKYAATEPAAVVSGETTLRPTAATITDFDGRPHRLTSQLWRLTEWLLRLPTALGMGSW